MKNYDELKWYVLIHDFNNDKIKTHNIFNHIHVKRDIEKALKNYITFKTFKEDIEKAFKYSYHSRAEYEIIVSGLFEKNQKYKINIWEQIEPNIDLICRYIIDKYNERIRNKIRSE